ncbi:MAG: hypothetical protein D6690_08185 [Nitrospirae bacterium]|nr:MAG: hypothetical protein D6690_08185 [Nitrospirota bacterium]
MSGEFPVECNTTKGFAERVPKNLQFIIDQRREGADVHEVTQLVMSLLGLIVFPYEVGALQKIKNKDLGKLTNQGWPQWENLQDERNDTKTLGDLTRHLRNAVSHRRLQFSSDDRALNEVEIEFWDGPSKNKTNWRAKIKGDNLKKFCDKFAEALHNSGAG